MLGIQVEACGDVVATGLDPSQSAAWLKDNRDRWAQVIKRAGIMME